MQDTQEQRTPQTGRALFITDRELAPMLGVSVAFLQKDRREAKRIPFIRLGDRCLYDPAEALAAVKALTIGGPRGRRKARVESFDDERTAASEALAVHRGGA